MSITDFIPGFTWVKFAAFGLAALALASGGAYAGYRWEAGVVAQVRLADAQAVAKAVSVARASDAAQAKVGLSAALSEAQAQTKIVTQTVTITKEIPLYVHDQIACPSGFTVGLARFLRAAADGADPATLSLAPGQSDDACSDLTATEMASWFSDYAGASQANAEELTALQAWVVANHQAQESAK